MIYEKQVTELFKKIIELPTLEERVAARDTILNKLDDHKWDFRAEDHFGAWLTCSDCDDTFQEWELEPGYNQPPHMPSGAFCQFCWNKLAEERWAEEGDQS